MLNVMAQYSLGTLRLDTTSIATAVAVGKNRYLLSVLMKCKNSSKFSLRELLNNWPHWDQVLAVLANQINKNPADYEHALVPSNIPGDTPVRFPNKLLAVGANYADHLLEMGLPVEKWHPMPFFSCPPSTSIVEPGKTVKFPHGTSEFDWECELVVVVGKTLRNTSPEQAADAIAGYMIGPDLSCRDLLVPGTGGLVDLMRGKAQETMKPCGPTFFPRHFVPNHCDFAVKLSVNGEAMIHGSTAQMIWKPEECLAEISKVLRLEPGDMVMTGTPAGSTKFHGGKYLRPGDRIEAEIGPLGILDVTVII